MMATAMLAEIAVRDEAARVEAFAHMHRRAQEGGLHGDATASGVPELVGTRAEVMRMLEYRIANGDADTVRRARAKIEELRTRSGAWKSAMRASER